MHKYLVDACTDAAVVEICAKYVVVLQEVVELVKELLR